MTPLRLAAGAWEATLLPSLGGAVATLRRSGIDILRPTPREPEGALDTACFPLVPYANRIAFGRFRFAERDIVLPRNFGDHPHTLHGVGWQRPWTVVDVRDDAATLRLTHAGDQDWPWPFEAEQRFQLEAGGMRTTLSLTAGDVAMPAGLGLHPYFPRRPARACARRWREPGWPMTRNCLPRASPKTSSGRGAKAPRRRAILSSTIATMAGRAKL